MLFVAKVTFNQTPPKHFIKKYTNKFKNQLLAFEYNCTKHTKRSVIYAHLQFCSKPFV